MRINPYLTGIAIFIGLVLPGSLARPHESQPISAKPVAIVKPLPEPSVAPKEAAQPVEEPAPAPAAPTPAPQPVGGYVEGCGDNEYAHYIYSHESGCNTNALNSIGCYGIGQACPASKLDQCGGDYACQNAWFSQYAADRYGGWYNAYLFWVNNHWW